MAETDYNPIRYVSLTSQGAEHITVPSPSGFEWSLEDVSSDKAGRTEDFTMMKMRAGQLRNINVSWRYMTTEQASTILNAFNPEYINVCYIDPMAGGYVTLEFYVGNRSAPLYNNRLGLWENISFSLIQRVVVANVTADTGGSNENN